LIVPDIERVKQFAHQQELDTSDLRSLLEHDMVQRLFPSGRFEKVNRELAELRAGESVSTVAQSLHDRELAS
jgi:hypothetical protein